LFLCAFVENSRNKNENWIMKETEILAYCLALSARHSLEDWQGEPELRKEFRTKAAELMSALDRRGLRLAGRPKAMDETLEHITTWQPRPAYRLEQEVPDPAVTCDLPETP